MVCVKCQTFLVTENYKGVKLMAEGWELLDILTDFTLGRTMRSILAGQCEDLGTLHIKPASSPKRKLYIRWAESSAREVWTVWGVLTLLTGRWTSHHRIIMHHHWRPSLLKGDQWPVISDIALLYSVQIFLIPSLIRSSLIIGWLIPLSQLVDMRIAFATDYPNDTSMLPLLTWWPVITSES